MRIEDIDAPLLGSRATTNPTVLQQRCGVIPSSHAHRSGRGERIACGVAYFCGSQYAATAKSAGYQHSTVLQTRGRVMGARGCHIGNLGQSINLRRPVLENHVRDQTRLGRSVGTGADVLFHPRGSASPDIGTVRPGNGVPRS